MPPRARAAAVASTLAILLVSAGLGLWVDWHAPGLARYAQDWLMRARGPLPVPDDIAIVAIDEPSMARFGRFPWSRQVMARTIDAIAADKPKVIAINVLFTDPTTQEDDDLLARSIGRAGNVVLAASLTDSPVHGGPSRWLLPIAPFDRAAAIGHINVQTEQDGAARQIAVRLADDSGRAILAMPIEIVRVADGTPEEGVTDTGNAVLVGSRTILVDTSAPSVVIEPSQSTKVLRGGRMTIDYVGPAGSFNPFTYSLSDVLAGNVSADKLRGKYVLIGATAAGMGERVASPFVRYTDAHADQHGALMPGVEVLANAVNVILRARYYTEAGDFAPFLWAMVAAALTLFLLEASQGGREVFKQTGGLVAVAVVILLASYISFTRFLVVPPLLPCLVAYGCAGILTLLRRSLLASARLDRNIGELAVSGDLLAPAGPGIPGAYQWGDRGGPVSLSRGWLPKGLEWKARTLSDLNARLLDRVRFVNYALRAVEDGLLIANPDGLITFANRAVGEILGTPARGLVGQNLAAKLAAAVDSDALARLVAECGHLEREFTVRDPKPRHFTLRVAGVSAETNGHGPAIGIVASFADITRQHELQQTKNDVISLVSHEMRTPLTAIQGMTELLANYEVPTDRRKEMTLAINDEVKRLTRMITEYLDITRLESGATAMRLSAVRVDTLLERILILLEPVAAARKIRLARSVPADLSAILADPDLLSRAVENLVSNAIKYSPDGTEVTISARADEEYLAIEVTDRGYGIPPADVERIFEKFYRVPRVQDAGTPGTGLGLSLVREIAELHRGTVAVKSEVDQGSTFTLRIPRETNP
jgi:PAS domain S-box-containing protein